MPKMGSENRFEIFPIFCEHFASVSFVVFFAGQQESDRYSGTIYETSKIN